MVTEQPPTITIGNRQIPRTRLLYIGVAILLALFILYGVLSGPTGEDAIVTAPTSSFLGFALLSFLGGVLSFVSPCTLPILPAYFAFAFRGGRSTIAANTMAFMLGLATMFAFLGAGASAIGRTLFDNQQLILLVGGALIVVFGLLSLLGGGFTGLSAANQGERSTTLSGSYFFGLTFAVGWSSCVGPILGIVLTLAATTANVGQGVILLFIYALGLGLPLLVMSAIFGRASRDSLIWRLMRGKGWDVETSNVVPAVIWGWGLWLILLPAIRQFTSWDIDSNPIVNFNIPFFNLQFNMSFTAIEFGLLALSIAAVIAFYFIRSGGLVATNLHLHSTQLFSGVLFILMGVLLLNSNLAIFNALVTPEIAERLAVVEESLLNLFSR